MGEKWMLGRQSIEYTPEGLIGFSNLADDPRSLWKDFFFFRNAEQRVPAFYKQNRVPTFFGPNKNYNLMAIHHFNKYTCGKLGGTDVHRLPTVSASAWST